MKSGQPVVIRSFDGVWNDPVSRSVTEMRPFEGYAVYNSDLALVDTLFIDPNLSISGNSAMKGDEALNVILWSIQILAESSTACDIDNSIAIHSQAAFERDVYDQAEPPTIGEYISVYFPYPQQGPRSESFCLDARPAPAEGEIWSFEVKTNVRAKVLLTFAGVETVPAGFEIWLVDEALQISQNLRENNQYTIAVQHENHPKALKLVVGTHAFTSTRYVSLNALPTGHELSQNFPNPFNPITTIRYGLPQDESVTLKVYDLLGKEISTLINHERKKAGYHIAIWDGRNGQGEPVTSGVYLYHILTSNFSSVKKMVIKR